MYVYICAYGNYIIYMYVKLRSTILDSYRSIDSMLYKVYMIGYKEGVYSSTCIKCASYISGIRLHHTATYALTILSLPLPYCHYPYFIARDNNIWYGSRYLKLHAIICMRIFISVFVILI